MLFISLVLILSGLFCLIAAYFERGDRLRCYSFMVFAFPLLLFGFNFLKYA